MKKLFPLLIAGVVFLIALVLIRPEATIGVVVASRDLPAGHALSVDDLTLQQFPRSLAPTGGYAETDLLIGQTLRVERTAGDVLYPTHLGGETIVLAKDERAIAIQVTDSAGLAGLLRPGDMVGITAVIFGGSGGAQGAFSKTISGGFRVLYLSPEFQAADPFDVNPPPQATSAPLSGSQGSTRREDSGTVVLAVPIQAAIVAYDFAAFGVESAAKVINILDLLPALDHATNVELSLFLEPENAKSFITSGVYLPDLVITPGPSPTPTETPFGEETGEASLEITTTPTPTP